MAISLSLSVDQTQLKAGSRANFVLEITGDSEIQNIEQLVILADKPGYVISPLSYEGDQIAVNGVRRYSASGYISRVSQPWLEDQNPATNITVKAFATVEQGGTYQNVSSNEVGLSILPNVDLPEYAVHSYSLDFSNNLNSQYLPII